MKNPIFGDTKYISKIWSWSINSDVYQVSEWSEYQKTFFHDFWELLPLSGPGPRSALVADSGTVHAPSALTPPFGNANRAQARSLETDY